MIEISLIRISPDSKYLDIIVERSSEYRFNTLNVYRYLGNSEYADPVDCSSIYDHSKTKQVLRIAANSFGSDITMYKVEFGLAPDAEGVPEVENEVAYCSNINFVYENMLDLALNIKNDCITDSEYDTFNRNHAILYAHTEAMRLSRFREAEMLYDIIWNLFSNCGPAGRRSNLYNKPCGC